MSLAQISYNALYILIIKIYINNSLFGIVNNINTDKI